MEVDTERDPAAVAELQSTPALHCTQLDRQRERELRSCDSHVTSEILTDAVRGEQGAKSRGEVFRSGQHQELYLTAGLCGIT